MPEGILAPHAVQLLSDPSRWRWIGAGTLPVDRARTQAHPPERAWLEAHQQTHPYPEFLVVLYGTSSYTLDGHTWPCRPGTVFFCDASVPHQDGYPPTPPDFDHLWIRVSTDQIFYNIYAARSACVTRKMGGHFMLDVMDLGLLSLTRFFAPHAEDAVFTGYRRMRAGALLQLIVAEILAGGSEGTEEKGNTAELQKKAVRAVQQHIRATAGKGVTLDGLADLTGYSKYHLLRLFQKQTGLSIHAWIDRCRRQRVQELNSTGYTQRAISEALGFSRPSSFSRWLRRQREAGR